ncbi:unnamed protein product [Arctogadus glacialis]
MVPSMGRRGADGCSVAAQPAPHLLPECEAAVVGKAQCEWEPGLMAGSQELSEEEGPGDGAEGGGEPGPESCLGEEGWASEKVLEGHGLCPRPGKASPPCHIPLKSKCRGTSPGRSGSMAQRLGRQAVTALGRGPARPAPTRPQPTPRLARAYGSQSADPQWTGRGPTLQGPIPGPPLVSGAPSEQGFSGMGPSGVCC